VATHNRREPLSRDRVLATAMAIADADGLDAVSIRGLARALGVEPMSLYNYTSGRDELLDALVERVAELIELPPTEGDDWRGPVRASAISAYHVLRAHPWACQPLMSTPKPSRARLRLIDALLGRLEEAGLPGELMDLAYHALDSHILGFTLWEAGYSRGTVLSGEDLAAYLREIHIDDYPHLATHARWHLEPHSEEGRDEFEFGLDLILDGVERLRPRAPGATPPG
jgi:AcrR family transcriptional regulator